MTKPNPKITPELTERFLSKVNKAPGSGPTWNCWLWTASLDAKGYGQFMLRRGDLRRAHRISYLIHNGGFDESLAVLHQCDNRRCVNPNHLFLGTVIDNNRDMREKGRNQSGDGNRKLTDEQIIEIRKMKSRGATHREIAVQFGITESHSCAITTGRCFRNLKGHRKEHRKFSRDTEIQEIRARFAEGGITRTQLAKEFNIASSTVGRILSGKTRSKSPGPITPNLTRKSFTKEQQQEIIESTLAGKSATELAERFNVSSNAISVVLYRHRKRGVKIPKQW